jgi:P4 family phage/plasmid primase-like protien
VTIVPETPSTANADSAANINAVVPVQKPLLDIAIGYLARDWRPIPVVHKTKEYDGTGALADCHINAANAAEYFNGHKQNIAVLLGSASGGLVDVDLDNPIALQLADVILPKTNSIFGRDGNPSSHRLHKIKGDPGKAETFIDGEMLVEYRAEHYTVFPGSTHTSGEAVEWVSDGTPTVLERDLLIGRIGVLATVTAIAKRWSPGNRDNLSAATSGILLRCGMPEEAVERIIDALCRVKGEDAKERIKHKKKVARFAKQITKNPTSNRVPSFGNLLKCTRDEEFVATVRKWLNMEESNVVIGPSDDDLALAFADKHVNDLRHVATWGRWLAYNGKHWEKDETLRVFDAARKLCRAIRDELLPTLKPAQQKALRHRLGSADTVYSVVRLAANDRRLAISHTALDADPWSLNTPGGTLDLRTGVMRPHNPQELLTKITLAAPGGECPLWLSTLKKVQPDEAGNDNGKQIRSYLQRLMGYALTGSSREHVLPFLHGGGRNGKDTIAQTIALILNDYAIFIPAETLLESHHERHPEELAVFCGARLVIGAEVSAGQRWNESRVKRLTGGNVMRARFMAQNSFEFPPTHTLIIVANTKPALRVVDEAIRARIHLLEFKVRIPDAEIDKEWGEKLKAEYGGILAWAIEGCREWQRIGLAPPASVIDATETYLDCEDHMLLWRMENCEEEAREKVTLGELFKDYRAWCSVSGALPLSRTSFSDRLAAVDGVKRYRRYERTAVMFLGLKLVERQRDNDDGGM